MNRLSPMELHRQAHTEWPDDSDAARSRYNELMREHGHIIAREPGDTSPLLPCGHDPARPAGTLHISVASTRTIEFDATPPADIPAALEAINQSADAMRERLAELGFENITVTEEPHHAER